ncbi:hypothetical protein FH972_021948 [Carpinus fangiana]|uniref:Uncharacterized protein n=1 Tax=Carpinus fangiana TaxID=176857 RepID=A0A5N6KRD5_9ROSI|nr:hypothetical protein FH972_021948 [Carpinus fangiana]
MTVSNGAAVASLNGLYPCRNEQILQLACLVSAQAPSPPALVVHGLEATGKSTITKAVLAAGAVAHAVVQSQECITGRHLLERTVAECLDSLSEAGVHIIDRAKYARCENISALAVHLQNLLEGRGKFALVFDGIDDQRQAPTTLLPALARLSELIPNLLPVFIITSPDQRFLHKAGVPHIHFPSYTRTEVVRIVSTAPPSPVVAQSPSRETPSTENLWPRFVAAVYDSLARGAAHDVVSCRELCLKLWPSFIAPLGSGTLSTSDFARLMVTNRALFQTEDMLIDSVLDTSEPMKNSSVATIPTQLSSSDLPYYSKYLLCAAYLASYNPARQDSLLFMRSTDRKKRRRGGGGAAGKSGGSNLASSSHAGRQAKNRKIPRRLLGPGSFPIERLLAIFHAILPHRIASTADLSTQIATLAALRLLVRSGIGGSSSADMLDASVKWRVNVGWDYVVALARGVGFEITDYVLE